MAPLFLLFLLFCLVAFVLGWVLATRYVSIATWVHYRFAVIRSALRVPRPPVGDYLRLALMPSGRLMPVLAGADDGDDSDDSDDDSADDDGDDSDDDDADTADDDDDSDSDDDDSDDDDQNKPSFLRRMARRHENRAKAQKKRADRLQAEVERLKNGGKGGDDDDDPDREALDAEKQGLEEERRSFRLEQSISRMSRKGIKVEVDGAEKALKFADPDDALLHIERQIRAGEIEQSDIFDDEGKVDRKGLKDALAELLEDKPHLAAASNGGSRKPKGGSGAGRGSGSGKDLESMSADDHFKQVRRTASR